MILFFAGLIVLLIVSAVLILTFGIGGIVFVLVFGDVIVCALAVYGIIRFICRRKKKKHED